MQIIKNKYKMKLGEFLFQKKAITRDLILLSQLEENSADKLKENDNSFTLKKGRLKKIKSATKKKLLVLKKKEELNKSNTESSNVDKSNIAKNSTGQVERVLTDKEKSTKKSRLKTKIKSVISDINEVSKRKPPTALVDAIKKSRFEFINLTEEQQSAIIKIVSTTRKEDLAIMLLLIPETTEEIKFFKEIVLNEQYMENLFNNIDYEVVD